MVVKIDVVAFDLCDVILDTYRFFQISVNILLLLYDILLLKMFLKVFQNASECFIFIDLFP